MLILYRRGGNNYHRRAASHANPIVAANADNRLFVQRLQDALVVDPAQLAET
jgi:hypothetical protein